MKQPILFAAALLLAAGAVGAQSLKRDNNVIRMSSTSLMRELSQKFDGKVGKTVGVNSPAEAAVSQVGAALPMYFVRLDALGAYDGKQGAESLLINMGLVTRLVSVQGQVKSLMIEATDTKQVVRAGGANKAALIAQAQSQLGQSGISADQLFLVELTPMNLQFIGYRSGNATMVASLADAPDYNLRAMAPVDAQTLFTTLAPVARSTPTMAP